jgi:hypothetical protein
LQTPPWPTNFVLMPNKNEEFKSNPKLFLQTYRFSSPDVLSDNRLQAAPIRVSIEAAKGDGHYTAVAREGDDAIPVYWLPFARGSVTKLQLGAGADFFLTSELTGCTFVIVASADYQQPLVAHFAGDLGWDVTQHEEKLARDPMHSSSITTPKPKAALSKALQTGAPEWAPYSQGQLDAAAENRDAVEHGVRGVYKTFGPPQYYDALRRYHGLHDIVAFNIVGWRKPNRGWRFYAQAAESVQQPGAARPLVREVRVTTKETNLADGNRGHPAYVDTVWKV